MKRSAILFALSLPALALCQFDTGASPGSKVLPSEGPLANILAPLTARSLGPVNMGGRIMDIAVYEKEPRIYFVATASGGVWKTENAGLSFTPVFDREGSISLGAVAVNQSNPDDIWVGTGEQSSRNSVAWGDGVYHTTDGGKTWQNMGLRETMHISEVLIDPRNPSRVLVGALGRLWGPNPERGMYETKDGGKTWKQVLFVNNDTGVIDLQRDPKNPNNLLASTWNRRRFAYDFISGGPGSAIYKSTDGGTTWRQITKGIPNQTLGRIGISYYRSNPRIVIASIEHGPLPGETTTNQQGAIRNGGGMYRSTDGGDSWTKVGNRNQRPFYFSRPEQDPVDENRIYMLEVNLIVSTDAGKTFNNVPNRVHSDYHAAWINPNDNKQMIVGTDGGIYETRDQGKTWEMHNKLPIGQFYAVAFDMRKPYWVYGGLQDNGSWGHPTQTTRGGVAFYDTISLAGGDGFHVQADPEDWSTVYAESQGGAITRVDLKSGGGRMIRPQGQGLRWNWSTPFILSPHNSKTIYIGGNKLFRSNNRGNTWDAISNDLSTQNPNRIKEAGKLSVTPENTGAEVHGTIITISESPRTPGVIYVGTDDGLVWLTRDGGKTWSDLTTNIKGVPQFTWVSRVLASKWADGRAYVTFDGHRENDFKPYVFVTEDYGKTWSSLSSGLPDFDSVYVVTEGERNPDLLFLGSEMSLRVSLDRGQTWTRFRNNFPTVAVHDLKIHPRELDLVIGTHGRSIWTMDINALEGLTKEQMAKDVVALKPQTVYLLGRVGNPWFGGDSLLLVPNSQPGTKIFYFLKQPVTGDVKVKISSADDTQSQTFDGTNNAGLNGVAWNGRLDNRLVSAGDYRVVVTAGGKDYVTSVKVEDLSGDRKE